MKKIEYSKEKDEIIKKRHGISFRSIKHAVNKGNLLAIFDNPNQKRYPEQRLLLVKMNNYVYAVPFVEDDEKIFLKTVFPSRKYTKLFLKKKEEKHEK